MKSLFLVFVLMTSVSANASHKSKSVKKSKMSWSDGLRTKLKQAGPVGQMRDLNLGTL